MSEFIRHTPADLVPCMPERVLAPAEEDGMRAFKGIVREGRVELPEGVRLPEGTTVTVTVGEAELLRSTFRAALRRNAQRRSRGRRLGPVYTAAHDTE